VLRFRLVVKRGPHLRPQASEGEARLDYFAGLDVSVKETSVCIVDDVGKIVREAKVASEPEALLQVLTNTIYCGHDRSLPEPAPASSAPFDIR
jgi:hypothetical protein